MNQITINKFFLWTAFLFSFCLVVGCGQKIKVACVKYNATEVDKWLSNADVSQFILQFSTPELNSKNAFQLISYVVTSNGTFLNADHPDALTTYKDSLIKLSGNAIFGNNIVLRKQFENVLSDSTGAKRSYDYILLIPQIDKTNQHVVYEIEAVKDGQILPSHVMAYTTNPCPPKCPTPPPPPPPIPGQ
jgi:hypothetical protein